MIKTRKTKFTALLLVLVTLFTALFIPINAAEPETSEDKGIEEIMPMAANDCRPIIFVNKHIEMSGYTPDATYYYTSNGLISGTIYSRAETNSFGEVYVRYDYRNYNGTPIGHGNIEGPHVHYYTWYEYNGNRYYKEAGIEPI